MIESKELNFVTGSLCAFFTEASSWLDLATEAKGVQCNKAAPSQSATSGMTVGTLQSPPERTEADYAVN
jgi:hypothetical protein